MKNKISNSKIVSLALLAAFAVGAVAFAQTSTPPNPPDPATMVQRRVQQLTKRLSLTPDQVTQATTIFTNEANTVTPLMPQLRTARQSLGTAVQSNDTTTINSTATTIGTLTAQITAANSTAQAQFLSILTADQKTKYERVGRRGRGPRGPGGFGMMGPGGMGMGFAPNQFRGRR